MATYDPEKFRQLQKHPASRHYEHRPIAVPYVAIIEKQLCPFERQPVEPHIVFTEPVAGLKLGDWSKIKERVG